LTLKLNALPFCNGLRIGWRGGRKSALLDINVSQAIRTKSLIQPEYGGGCKVFSSFIASPEYSLENLAYFVTHSLMT
jgi:hypothetical protein